MVESRKVDDITVLTPGQAAEAMGVSDVTLRRYARAYERVFDDLTPDKGGRLFSGQVLDRLTAAKAMQESGQAVSLEQALLMLREGVEAPAPVKMESSEVLDLSEEARGTLAAILRDELRAIIREEVAAAVERLEEQNRVLHEEIMALEPAKEVVAVDVADPETQAELEEQRRLNAYLKGEIVRRDLEAEAVKRRWWKWW